MSANGKCCVYIYHLLTYRICCWCLCDTVAHWWWLQYVAETCSSTKTALCSGWK